MAVHVGANIDEAALLSRKVRDMPTALPLAMNRHNEADYYRGISTSCAVPFIECTAISLSMRLNAIVYDGSDEFKGMQLSQILGIKMPPFVQCQIVERDSRIIIRTDQDFVQLGAEVIKEHVLAFQSQGVLTESPAVSSWWDPYDKEQMMRYGHRLNTSIPPSVAEAEFPSEPWPKGVVIRIK
jgi:hypothetical protein